MITVSTRNSTDRHCNCNTFNKFYHATTDKRIQMSCLRQNTEAMPSGRTWLRAIGNIKVTAQTYNDIIVFTVKATQYVSGSATTINLAEFDIIVRHNVAKKNLYERTKKAKIRFQSLHRGRIGRVRKQTMHRTTQLRIYIASLHTRTPPTPL